MAPPKKHLTEEARRDALRACWRAYNAKHKAERSAHNKEYVRRPEVKERLKERRLAREAGKVIGAAGP